MHKFFFLLLFLFTFFKTYSQIKKEWQEGYKLSVLDLQAEAPTTTPEQGQTYYLATSLEVNNALNIHEFKRTKNFNKYVAAFFIPANSWLQQGEGTEILLQYAQMDFDLLELYARKLRKRLYAGKNPSSDSNLMKQAHKQISTEMARRRLEMHNAAAESESRRAVFHEQILKEIAALAEFCQACPPTQK